MAVSPVPPLRGDTTGAPMEATQNVLPVLGLEFGAAELYGT